MNHRRSSLKAVMNLLFVSLIVAGLFSGAVGTAAAQPTDHGRQDQVWSFGVIADTQWTVADDGYNPNKTAVNIIQQVDQQFIAAGVKFVVAVGDTTDWGTKTSIDTRALYAQELYNAGIGFYPLRGNHEATEGDGYLNSGIEFQYAFPQIGTGINNTLPDDITPAIIPAADLANVPPAAKTGSPFTVGTHFSAPVEVNTQNNSLSYAFQYNNATFVLLDQFNVAGNYYDSTVPQQQDWINQTLAGRPANSFAFVFAHKNLLGGNHKDNLFGGPVVAADPGDGYGVDPSTLPADAQALLAAKQQAMNAFISSMQANNVAVVVTGHDHHHYASLVTSPDGASKVQQLITQSDSSKFYKPVLPVSANDAPIQQDLYRVGYYLFTVAGPIVTVDYYGDTTGNNNYGVNGGRFNFVKMSTLSYSLNGKENLVPQGGSYAMTDDTTKAANMVRPFEHRYKGTSMAILSGTNTYMGTTNYGKALNYDVVTGWAPFDLTMASDTLSLRGLSKLAGAQTDTFVLSMSYDTWMREHGLLFKALLKRDRFGLLARDANGDWVKAASLNFGGSPKFVVGPYQATDGLGTYGVDPATNTAWAVINYNGDFAVGVR